MTIQNERIWDFSTLDTFLTCRKKYYWRMVRDLQPKTVSPALEFGKAIHCGLEAYYKATIMNSDLPLDCALKAFASNYNDREGEELRTVENGIKLLTAYALVYKDEPLKITEVEVGFVVPLESNEGSILYAGRLDALTEWDGQLFVLEHKTTSYLKSTFFKQFNPNMQIDGYIYAAQHYKNKKCLGVVINALEPWKEVKRQTEKTKKTEDHFARDVSSRSETELQEFAKQAIQITRDIKECEQKGEFYQNKHACFNYNYECPFKQLCLYGDDPRLIKRDYFIEKWEPYKEEVKNGE